MVYLGYGRFSAESPFKAVLKGVKSTIKTCITTVPYIEVVHLHLLLFLKLQWFSSLRLNVAYSMIQDFMTKHWQVKYR